MRSINATGSTSSIENVNAIGFFGNIIPTICFSILEDITQQLLESKHTVILGKLFKIALDLKQYVTTKLALGKRIVTKLGLNLVITSLTIDPHMVVI
jgi:glycopeptide antibiotics resistance protein